jgi:hypothetical protein
MQNTAAACGVALAVLSCACAPTNANRTTPILPLRTLRLYETGVGYFERSGSLDGSATTSLPIPAGHLDDALETLVVLNRGGQARVHGVEFGSSLPKGMARALAGLPIDGDAPLGIEELLHGLKGSGVEIRTAAQTFSGRLVDVVHTQADGASVKPPAAPDGAVDGDKAKETKETPAPPAMLVVLTDDQEIVRVPMAQVEAVRPKDPSYATRLGSALDALSTRSAQSERMLHVLSGGGPVTLGYVAEAPVWRATYRLVFDSSGAGTSAVLEGWALLHNDTDETWKGVRVELANGRPDAFLFPLAAPRYARRALVTPQDPLATVPQLLGTTVDAIWGDQTGDSFGAGGLALSGVGDGGGGSGQGIGLGRIGTVGHGGGTGTLEGSSSLLEVGNLAGVANATGVEAGALFVYSLKEPVDLRARGSALVPFSQERVYAEPIAWVDSPGTAARSAVHLVNSTPQTLPPGTLAFFGDGGFLGESALPRLKPGDVRFLTYGMDMDLELRMSTPARVVEESKHLVWDKHSKTLTEHFLRTTDFAYEIENRSGRARSIVFALPFARNSTVAGPDRMDFDVESGRPLAVFRVDARQKPVRAAHAVEGLTRSVSGDSLTSQWVTDAIAKTSLPEGERAVATEAGVHLKEREQLVAAADRAKAEIAEVEKDLERLREHMKALSGERAGAAQPNPFAVRILAGEDRLTAARVKLAKLVADAKAQRESAELVLAKLAR